MPVLSDSDLLLTRRPPRGVALAVSALLVVVWGTLRLIVLPTSVFPLTYAIPLLVGVWTRQVAATWAMAGTFIILHHLKLFWMLPAGTLSSAELWANYGTTLVNILVAATAVHGIIRLRTRLETALQRERAQAEELRAQGEELAQQNEELAQQGEELSRQAEELSQQGEELASRNEELQAQAEQIATLNALLERRGALLQVLLETARASGSEHTALGHLLRAAVELFGESCHAAVVYERTNEGLRIGRIVVREGVTQERDGDAVADEFVALVLDQNRTACLVDTTLRPDLSLLTLAGRPPFGSVLCSPVRMDDVTFGALAVYGERGHEWTEEEFLLVEWLADQSGRVLQTLRVQSDLREADRQKDEFLATLSHELRNPLAPIRFALKLIQDGDGHSGPAMRVLQRQVLQLTRLVDDLLDATRLSSNKVKIVKSRLDLVTVVQHAVEAARPGIEEARQTLSLSTPDVPLWVDGDAERLEQVVTNLLNNAIRYTPSGGRITVSLAGTDHDVELSVADTGVGLAEGDQQRVFDMFTQIGGPGSGGLGIGLALVRGIVRLHGGAVVARSEGPGRGCDFRVTLPRAMAQTEVAASPSPPVMAAAPCRVLVVDDNLDSADMMAELLREHGHTVAVAYSGEQALETARVFLPETALLDIGLPGVDGYELARRFRDDPSTRAARLIALTGWGQEADRARARDAGFDSHLTKPADPAAIFAALHRPAAT